MPHFRYFTQSANSQLGEYSIAYYWEVPAGVIESATTKCLDDDGKKGHTSSSYKTNYEMLPNSLKSCLDYCALLYSCGYHCDLEKDRMIRLMVAEGLIEEKGTCLEEVVSSLIDELADRGMLFQYFNSSEFTTCVEIQEDYYELCVIQRDEEDFLARNPLTPIRVFVVHLFGNICPRLLENLPIQYLFLRSRTIPDQATIDLIGGLTSLFVLQFEWDEEDHILFNKIEELINLKFLSLCLWDSSPFTPNLINFQQLQTLELNCDFDSNVLEQVATITTLRRFSCKVRVPKRVEKLVNLQTLVDWDARSDVIEELSSLNQLRRFDVRYVRDENINKLLESIASMKKLIHLSMRADSYFLGDCGPMFPLLEPFYPPTQLQELCLSGTLMELPDWIISMENLTTLVLTGSHLTENPSTFFQFLPNLKFLSLNNAYQAKFIGKEFCGEGGFPKLETLEIRSDYLVGWSEIAKRSFPCLTSLLLKSRELRFFPEGAQHISKLEILELVVHEDLRRRLNGDENYKIKHILSVSMYKVNSIFSVTDDQFAEIL